MIQNSFKFEKFSKKQRMVFNWWADNSPVKEMDGIIADGAIRSGKTLCMSLSFVMWAMDNFNGQNFGMCGKTHGSFRRNVLNVLKLTLPGRGYGYRDHRGDGYLEVRKGDTVNYFYIFSGNDERSQDLVQGITLAGVFFDEVALMPESFVNQATARCSVEGSKFWFNCNPEGPYHWFYTKWIQDTGKKLLYLHFTMNDNYSLSEKMKARYRTQYSGVFYDRFILGKWVIAEGLIYDMFSWDKNVVELDDISDRLTGARYISIDYGTQNPTVFKLWEKGLDQVWYCTKEYYYSGRDERKQKTDAEYVEDLTAFIGTKKVNAIIVDPSAASFIEAIRRAGIPVMQADNEVIDGIRQMARHLQAGTIKYTSDCEHTFKEFGSYTWDPRASEHGEDRPIKANDHCMDADRYFVRTVLGKRKAKVANKARKGLH